ncbi:unnamed protein product [Schistocephalus solidus]|uniref:Uncharacterized protein n=1 Tax=Schistocephalus solidus TaxID=70667 RepID=A0A3P7EZW0_SCHSO|nr:unnamed protein product [Schistocephalus solidus]
MHLSNDPGSETRNYYTPFGLPPSNGAHSIPRLLNHFLSQRWYQLCLTSHYQFGFQERDGTAKATFLLHGILRYAISAPRCIAVAVLDVAKAFDSVNHGTLLRAAETNGAPPLLLNLLA